MLIWFDPPHTDPLRGHHPHFTIRRLSSHGFPKTLHSQESSFRVCLTPGPSSLTKALSLEMLSLTQALSLVA